MGEEPKPLSQEKSAVEKRLWWFLVLGLVTEILVSLVWRDWRLTGGILFGGILASFNFYLLQTSVRAFFQSYSNTFAVTFFLRYIAVGLIVWILYSSEIFSIFGMLLGISSFVIALMLEAAIQLFAAITKREGF